MKKILFISTCLVLLLSCTNQKKTKTENHTYVHYKQKVNGYNVSVKIIKDSIKEKYFSDIATREAELTFKKINQELKVVNPYYADYKLYEESIKKGMTVDYIPFEMLESNTFSGNQSPFFFFDVDFDGEEELIICLWEAMGYHGHHAYQAYKTDVGNGTHLLSPMQGEPFCDLNDYSEFNPIEKTISIPQGVGLKMGGEKIYGLVDGSFKLIERTENDWEHTNGVKYELCKPTTYHYKIVNGTEILDRIERCPKDI